ncbi:bifunctional 3-(3-hydroxy-phenyl)propionate/3-hydroxycinnamic acid hydroxylase [Mycobacterium sp. CPCC 205372]|uniref:Bifunctional 3-(3-hydroxy-phenyl)propionate/3-hydroxycinnamic acid hydroxylase n=1 Tax=Mycobacterium hippophais TaxID=3016340 RepID=A0ABT4PZ01_9MYCO|nr:bifunctional 3-(3-hydroxy-phenyl)propionate/3-hydroxycinnamic acid hydroxylase [Mycobacterium hippophais]MCZ8381814.1 bifunctional 3-(3-hydroxy-phenyl)propionate/3-hydroxycinnamic acid hydroxylase [Mycobacterium hippophais]
MTHVPVAVVGAGPTGVAAATLLAQYGVEVLVLDRWTAVYPQPRAVHLDDEVCRIIARLGVADEFMALSRPGLGLRLLDRDLTVLAEFRRDPRHSPNGFPQANMFDQPELETLLRANLARHPRARLLGGVEVVEVVAGTVGPARITAVDRTDGRRHVITADYVLGCDGANSLVRAAIGSAMRDLKFEQRWLVVDVATAADLRQWEGVHQVCDPDRAATYMRIGENRYRWEFRLRTGESAADYQSLTALRPLIEPWTAGVPDHELDVLRVTEYTFRAQIADRWRRGNAFLLGDAAHLTPPFVGQGLGAGLRDAMNLAWKLAGVLTDALPRGALDTYEQERKPHARHMIGLALNVGRAMTAGGELGSLARRAVVPRLHRIPAIGAKLLDSQTPRLHRSPLVRRKVRGLGGRLCPNSVVLEGQRLDSVLGIGFAVVSATPLGAADAALAERAGAVVHVAEPGSEVAEWLRRGHATVAVVRPDRTVMCAGRDTAALFESLPALRATAGRTR